MRWSLSLLLLAACSSSSTPPARPAPSPPPESIPATPPPQTAAVTPLPAAEQLEPAKPVEKSIKSGESHRYRVQLRAGHVVTGVVMQNGIDVEVITYDTAGKQLAAVDSPNGEKGPEPFVIEATTAGAYDFVVRPFVVPADAGAPPPGPLEGKYDVRIELLTPDAYAELQAKQRFASPRIRELWGAIRTKRQDAIEKFWADLAGKSPIVEPYPGDPKDVLVSFVYRAKTPYVGMFGGDGFREKPLVRLGDSDLWWLSMRMPADARFDYAFIATDSPPDALRPFTNGFAPDPRYTKKQFDPNNPSKRFDQSYTVLPGARPQPWLEAKPDIAKGKLAPLKIASKHLKEDRNIGVYTPPGYDPKKRYPLVIAFDGEVYGLGGNALIPLPTILDNLIAAKKIPPVVAALVANQGTRARDLPGSAPFSAFLATELVPKLRADYRAGMTAADTIVTGSSFGGLCSAYTALHHANVIGNVLSQSGSYQYKVGAIDNDISPSVEGGWLIRDYAKAKKLPLRFYLDAGLFEEELLASNRHMRDVLVAKGYPVTYAEFSGGHDYWVWRHTIADGLIALLQKR